MGLPFEEVNSNIDVLCGMINVKIWQAIDVLIVFCSLFEYGLLVQC